MSVVQTLRNRGNKTGTAVRPHDNDGVGPPGGTAVTWVVAQPIQDLIEQGSRIGWGHLGEIGDFGHLRKHGDHTPWSLGKQRGIVYAKDTAEPSWVQQELLKLCRRDDYDTTWIDFININNRQFSFSGVDQGFSGDAHLHVSVRKGHELRHVTLFDDLVRAHNGQQVGGPFMSLTKAEQKRLLKNVENMHFMLSSRGADLGHPFQVDRRDWSKKLDAILQAVGGDNTEQILAAIKAEEEKSRQAMLDKIDAIAPTLAAAVAAELETDLDETAIAEALAAELASRLTD